MPDKHGYPTEDELFKIRDWPCEDVEGLINFVGSIWWAADWGWRRSGNVIYASTGGWSGNEDIISAMQSGDPGNAFVRWSKIFYNMRRGGHFTFVLDDSEPDIDWVGRIAPTLLQAEKAGIVPSFGKKPSMCCGQNLKWVKVKESSVGRGSTIGCVCSTDLHKLLSEAYHE